MQSHYNVMQGHWQQFNIRCCYWGFHFVTSLNNAFMVSMVSEFFKFFNCRNLGEEVKTISFSTQMASLKLCHFMKILYQFRNSIQCHVYLFIYLSLPLKRSFWFACEIDPISWLMASLLSKKITLLLHYLLKHWGYEVTWIFKGTATWSIARAQSRILTVEYIDSYLPPVEWI